MTVRNRVVGIIATETAPDLFDGSLHHPNTFRCEVISEFARDLTAGNIVDAPAHAEQSVTDAALALVERGATHVTSNCGYTVLYADALRRSIDVPVFVSNLQLLPMLARCTPASHRIGILTYDAEKLSEQHLVAAVGGKFDRNNYAIRGLEKTSSWADWARAEPEYNFESARRDILDAVDDVLKAGVACLVLECEVMIPFAGAIKATTDVPVYDLVSSLRFLFGIR